MDAIDPHATFVSDAWGQSETHPAFRQGPCGILVNGTHKKYYSTKLGGRIQVCVSPFGAVSINQHNT